MIGYLCGLMLPAYWLDGSVVDKTFVDYVNILLIAMWIAASGLTWRQKKEWAVLATTVFVIVYCAAVFLRGQSGIEINVFYPIIFFVLCYKTPAGQNEFVLGFFLGALLTTIFGWFRFVTGSGGMAAEHALGYWGVKYTAATRNSDALAPLYVAAIATYALLKKSTYRNYLLRRTIYFLSFSIGGTAVMLSYSRGAWLTLATFCLLAVGYRSSVVPAAVKRVAAITILGLALILLWPAFLAKADLASLGERLSSIFSEAGGSNLDRVRLLSYAAMLISNFPLLGVGFGKFSCCYYQFGYGDLVGALHPENFFVQLATDYGLVVGAMGALLLFRLAIVAYVSRREPERALGCGLLSLLVWLQFNSELYSLLLWVLLGVICSVIAMRGAVA